MCRLRAVRPRAVQRSPKGAQRLRHAEVDIAAELTLPGDRRHVTQFINPAVPEIAHQVVHDVVDRLDPGGAMSR